MLTNIQNIIVIKLCNHKDWYVGIWKIRYIFSTSECLQIKSCWMWHFYRPCEDHLIQPTGSFLHCNAMSSNFTCFRFLENLKVRLCKVVVYYEIRIKKKAETKLVICWFTTCSFSLRCLLCRQKKSSYKGGFLGKQIFKNPICKI